ncbi:multidrug efflux pump subunit AcrA (membrane-fusion protein) [Arcticibacter pallidicorallinus]|uniref:Multidrug efflux pump subunit AcrA (Membrane-fusion protein) n=1 Tax=Arcticibacter pallidicorallinus TaxID=1259464 RepID=A0A2T0U8X6_9SPHI|nr:efflux RND transporter periplasmic adaptor subunit [Arcticibacter pallidicorallinus]PRY54379.1 multidrug efflux pump subunit AcrA (membrane-fusion protein) [Arcticibacter pallidicorallinus]
MRRILKDSRIAVALLVLFSLFGCGGVGGKKNHEQTMMDHDAVHDSLSHLVKPTDEVVIASMETIKPQKGSRFANVSAQGRIGYNENNVSSQSARVSGRIERLYVKYNYQPISKGQKLMDIYSPDIVNAQQELLFLHENHEQELAEMAKRKLLLLGVTNQQISHLLNTGKVSYTFSVYSTISGYIVENLSSNPGMSNASGSTVITSSPSATGSSDGMDGMGSSAAPAPELPALPESSPLQLREGQYISQGQTLFKVINSNEVWAEFYVQPEQLEIFKRGAKISITSANEEEKSADASVSIVRPFYSSGESYPLVRAILQNSRKNWRIGELVQVSKEEVKKDGVWLPRTAVLGLGGRSVSFVKEDDVFVPVEVKVQGYAGGWVDIGESIGNRKVALNAWFLMDSESFVQVRNR